MIIRLCGSVGKVHENGDTPRDKWEEILCECQNEPSCSKEFRDELTLKTVQE